MRWNRLWLTRSADLSFQRKLACMLRVKEGLFSPRPSFQRKLAYRT